MTKINTFYSEKLAEATRKFATLKSELSSAAETQAKQDRRLFGRAKRGDTVYREKVKKMDGGRLFLLDGMSLRADPIRTPRRSLLGSCRTSSWPSPSTT